MEWLYDYEDLARCGESAGSCSDCGPYGAVESCTECTESPTEYTLSTSCFTCCANAQTATLTYVSGCTWQSPEFTCGTDNYRWVLVIGTTTTLSLERTAGSGALIEAEYEKTTAWDCLCENVVDLVSFENCSDPAMKLCIAPEFDLSTGSCVTRPRCWEVVITGFSNGTCLHCDEFNGTWLFELGSNPLGGGNECSSQINSEVIPCGLQTEYGMTFSLTSGGAGGAALTFYKIGGAIELSYSATGFLSEYTMSKSGTLSNIGNPAFCTEPATIVAEAVDCP